MCKNLSTTLIKKTSTKLRNRYGLSWHINYSYAQQNSRFKVEIEFEILEITNNEQ